MCHGSRWQCPFTASPVISKRGTTETRFIADAEVRGWLPCRGQWWLATLPESISTDVHTPLPWLDHKGLAICHCSCLKKQDAFSGLHSHQGQVGRMGLCKSKFVQGGFFRQNLQLPFFMTSIHFSDIGITYYIYKDGRIHLFLGAKQDFLWQLTPCAFLVPSITQFLETETWIFSSAYNLKMQREVQRIYRTEGWHLGYVDILFLSLRWLNT